MASREFIGRAAVAAIMNILKSHKNKLDGVDTGANKYTHPTTHDPSIIAQNANSRFVTDTEKAAWNAKAASNHTHPAQTSVTGSAGSVAAAGVQAGTLAVGVKATDSTDYTTSRLRNAYFATAVPSSLANGTICFVYE